MITLRNYGTLRAVIIPTQIVGKTLDEIDFEEVGEQSINAFQNVVREMFPTLRGPYAGQTENRKYGLDVTESGTKGFMNYVAQCLDSKIVYSFSSGTPEKTLRGELHDGLPIRGDLHLDMELFNRDIAGSLLYRLTATPDSPFMAYVNNDGALALEYHGEFPIREKHLSLAEHLMRGVTPRLCSRPRVEIGDDPLFVVNEHTLPGYNP